MESHIQQVLIELLPVAGAVWVLKVQLCTNRINDPVVTESPPGGVTRIINK